MILTRTAGPVTIKKQRGERKMDKKAYETPEMEIIELEQEDVITASGDNEGQFPVDLFG